MLIWITAVALALNVAIVGVAMRRTSATCVDVEAPDAEAAHAEAFDVPPPTRR